MSSVLIKGMDMPQNCQNCMDANLNIAISLFGAMCPFCEKIFVADINIRKQRHPDCPLVEIPTPHGRLIDADKFKSDYSMKDDCAECEKELRWSSRACEYDRIYSKMDFCQWIDNAETVIEAEGGETDA